MGLSNMISRLLQYFLIKERPPINQFSEEELLQDAHQKLVEARNIFSSTDPEFIDYAVYNLRAAEEKYNSLIKQIKGK